MRKRIDEQMRKLQGLPKEWSPCLVNLVPALAYQFCLVLPARNLGNISRCSLPVEAHTLEVVDAGEVGVAALPNKGRHVDPQEENAVHR